MIHLVAFAAGRALSRIRVGAEFRSVPARILERRAGCDLEVIVAGLAPDVILPVIAAAFADRPAVQESDFARVIHAIPWLTHDVVRQIFSLHRRILESRM